MSVRSIATAAGLVLTATCAWAADAPSPPPTTPLDGLTVAVPRTAPVVVSTWPAQGAVIAPGALVLKVTFDQAMDPDMWGYAKAGSDAYPLCLKKARLLNDGRTFVLLCTTGDATAYAVGLNGGAGPGFASVGHRAAEPYELKFSTSKGRSVTSVKEALTAAGLKDEDNPIMGAEQAGG
jgi:hypothetical protein